MMLIDYYYVFVSAGEHKYTNTVKFIKVLFDGLTVPEVMMQDIVLPKVNVNTK